MESLPSRPAEACPKCGSRNVTPGRLSASRHAILPTFQPTGTSHFRLSLANGVEVYCDPSFACLDCGLVWDYLRPDELKEFISQNCREPGEPQDAYALLCEGVRLESRGDTAGALAKYAAVIEKFPGSAAAKDAECSIRNLKDALG